MDRSEGKEQTSIARAHHYTNVGHHFEIIGTKGGNPPRCPQKAKQRCRIPLEQGPRKAKKKVISNSSSPWLKIPTGSHCLAGYKIGTLAVMKLEVVRLGSPCTTRGKLLISSWLHDLKPRWGLGRSAQGRHSWVFEDATATTRSKRLLGLHDLSERLLPLPF